MVMQQRPYSTFLLGGERWTIASKSGVRQSFFADGPATEEDLVPFTDHLPYGSGGMGSSLPAVRNQMHYSTGLNTEGWDRIEPGPLHQKLGLAMDEPATCFAVARDNDAAGNWYLYAGMGRYSKKIRLRAIGGNPALGTVETKDHGVGAVITAITVVKDGPSETVDRWGTVQVGTGRIVFGYGTTARIQQINTVGVDAVDTYAAPAGTASYAGVFVLGPGATATENKIWKSARTTVGGAPSGAFSSVQGMVVQDTTDMTADANWLPTPTPYRVGGYGSPIMELFDIGGALHPLTTDALYNFDGTYTPRTIFSMKSFRHDGNGRGSRPWGQQLFICTGQDLMAWPDRGEPTIGISTLMSNLSPIQGRPTCVAPFGPAYLFVSYYDPQAATSYLIKMRRRRYINAPHEFLFFPQHLVGSYRQSALTVTADGGGSDQENVYLFYPCPSATSGKHDIGYTILSGPGYGYATGGVLYTTLYGDVRRRMRLLRLVFYAQGCDANNKYTPAIELDLSGSYVPVGDGSAITTNGRVVKSFTLGTNDTCSLLRLRLTEASQTPSGRPILLCPSTEREGPGGVVLEGLMQPDTVRRFRIVLSTGNRRLAGGGREGDRPQERMAALRAMAAPLVLTDMVHPDEFGNDTPRKVIVQKMSELYGPQLAGLEPSQRHVEVSGILAQYNPT